MTTDLPKNWALARLAELAHLNPGSWASVPMDDDIVSFVPMAAVGVDGSGLNPGQGRPWAEVKKGYTRFLDGDVLFAKITPCMENGKVAIAERLVGGRGVGSTEFHVLRPAVGIRARYLFYFLLQEPVRRAARATMKGTAGQLRVPQDFLSDLPVPVAPLAEQDRIVAEIEKHFTRLDAAVAALKHVQANLKRYRAAVLKTACEGRLVRTEAELARREGRAYERGDTFLAGLGATATNIRAVRGRGGADRPTATLTTASAAIPEGWTLAEVGRLLAERPCNGMSVKASEVDGVPALRLNAMTEKGFDFTQIRHLPLDWEDVQDIEVREGDFFVSRGSGSPNLVGRGTLAQAPPFKVIFPDTMIRLRFLAAVARTRWVPTIWPAAWIRRQIESRVKTTAGILKIAQPEVLSLIVPLPPLAEQTRIVNEVERQFSVVEGISAVVNAGLARADALRRSLLTTAFEGRLVAQDSRDEPASSLLNRTKGGTAYHHEDWSSLSRGNPGVERRQAADGPPSQES